MPPIKTFRIPLGFTVLAIVGAFVLGGVEIGIIVALLAVLEISISFDNAIVNAHVLKTMTERWQKIFLTWGILIAVFGMRLVFPIVIVAAAAGLSIPDVLDQAINDQDTYAENLERSNPVIASFGGIFLLMVFLNFFFDEEKDVHWLRPVERALAWTGGIKAVSVAIALVALLVISQVVAADEQVDVLVAGLVGLIAYLISNGVADRLEPDDLDDDEFADHSHGHHPKPSVTSGDGNGDAPTRGQAAQAGLQTVGKAGFASFMYLELLDASFSFDGVIGAFAISKNIFVIAVGLGLGALFIRTLTVYLVHQGTLQQYRFLEHGAHWAIGVLAVLLFIGIEYEVPEVITGLLGAVLIAAALWSSILANRREDAEYDDEDGGSPPGAKTMPEPATTGR